MAISRASRAQQGSRDGRWPVFTQLLVDRGQVVEQGEGRTAETSRQPRRPSVRQTSERRQGAEQGGAGMAERQQDQSIKTLFAPQGVLTGATDLTYFMTSTAGFTLWNKFRAHQDKRDDLGWAVGEILLGTLVAMSLSEAVAIDVASGSSSSVRSKKDLTITGPTTFLNIALGAAAAGMTYLLNGRPK